MVCECSETLQSYVWQRYAWVPRQSLQWVDVGLDRITIDLDQRIGGNERAMFGGFVEHLGRYVGGGMGRSAGATNTCDAPDRVNVATRAASMPSSAPCCVTLPPLSVHALTFSL